MRILVKCQALSLPSKVPGTFFAFFVALLLIVTCSLADAALKAGPSRVVLIGKPHQNLKGHFYLENTGEERLRVFVEPEDWARGIGGDRKTVDWLAIKPKELTLKPGGHKKIKYKVHVPKDATGELRAQVFFSTEVAGEGAAAVRSRLGSIIYVAIEGTERVEAEVTGVSARYTPSVPDAARPDQLEVVLSIRNKGNVHVVPEGAVLVRDAQGDIVVRTQLLGGWGLLPNEQDRYRAIAHGLHLKPGSYTLKAELKLGSDIGQAIRLTHSVEAAVSEDGTLSIVTSDE